MKTDQEIEKNNYEAIRNKAIEHASKAHNRESMRVSSIRENDEWNNRMNNFIEGAQYMQAACAKDMEREWISVEDEMPITKLHVLVHGLGNRQFTAFWDGSHFNCYNPFNESLEQADEVTHWQPLPSPPQSTEKGGESE